MIDELVSVFVTESHYLTSTEWICQQEDQRQKQKAMDERRKKTGEDNKNKKTKLETERQNSRWEGREGETALMDPAVSHSHEQWQAESSGRRDHGDKDRATAKVTELLSMASLCNLIDSSYTKEEIKRWGGWYWWKGRTTMLILHDRSHFD